MGKIRGTHSSPGHYTKITDLSYASKTIGITNLGLVGETKKGPAFEPYKITKIDEYRDVFGGTDTTKFKDSQYPKYELPYIAESYLKASDSLWVCRVLGLSGYKAGKAFVITASGDDNQKHVVALLRSKGSYSKYGTLDICAGTSDYDVLNFDCDSIELKVNTDYTINPDCNGGISKGTATGGFDISSLNLGRFVIVAKKGDSEIGRYPVSFNAGAKDYIYKVLGSNPQEGNAPLFVEEFYDVMLQDYADGGIVNKIDSGVTVFEPLTYKAVCDPVVDVVNIPSVDLKRKHVGLTFVCDKNAANKTEFVNEGGSALTIGTVYKVIAKRDENNVKKYVYSALKSGTTEIKVGQISGNTVDAVFVKSLNNFVYLNSGETELTTSSDMSDYHENFRCAITPWIVSEIKGTQTNMELKKLFRFYTISDGNCANEQIKISIANISPDDGTFDVYIRDFYDSDANPTFLETYKRVTMMPGTPNYIGLKIGTVDGSYEAKSKYVAVEIIENDMTAQCVPAGFLGYPVRTYSNLKSPIFKNNVMYYDELKDRKQYFGISDLVGIDVDILNYKGANAYTEDYNNGYTKPFHLDSRLSKEVMDALSAETESGVTVTIDGENINIEWETVSASNVTMENLKPMIGTEEEMEGTIYENLKVRKFTVCPYGGFDGWDIYRNSRTNTNEFKASNYKGAIKNGHGDTFSKLIKAENLSLTGNCITSDYYAYLAGINQFADADKVEINLFATPGIDYVNNELLVNDAIEMVENRLDTFYVLTTPDKPWGASDAVDEMYSSSDAAANLEDSDIDTYYAATYYPWVSYFDKTNNKFINLPVSKDVLRNMANIDNKKYPWYTPAGLERGKVECNKMHISTKLEDRDNVYDARINPVMSFSREGVKIWGNKTMYKCEETNPMNRVNTVRLVLYLRKLIILSTLILFFDPNDETLADEFDRIVRPILNDIKADRGITDFRLVISQTPEQMDAHELSCNLFVKPTPVLEYIEINFVVTPQGIDFDDINI